MKEDILKKMSTINYIDSWAKQVRIQAMEMKKLFNSNFGTRWRNYSLDLWEVEDGIDDIIGSVDQITDNVEEMEL